MNKPVGGLGGRRRQKASCSTYAVTQIGEGLFNGALRQADASTEFLQEVRRHTIEAWLFTVYGKRDVLVEPEIA